MIITKQSVLHKVFGRGTVCAVEGSCIGVVFGELEKRFVFPDAFEKFLKFEDENAQSEVLEMIEALNSEKRAKSDALVTDITEQLRENEKKLSLEASAELDSAFDVDSDTDDADEYSTIFDWRPLGTVKASR